MDVKKVDFFQGKKIEILEMILKNVDNQLDVLWKIQIENEFFQITFSNVSRFRMGVVSLPLEIHGFEILKHSQNGWEKDSTYEIRDFEDDRIGFFCECFETEI